MTILPMNKLDGNKRNLRSIIRNYLLPMSIKEVEEEINISIEKQDWFRAACCFEYLNELKEEN